MNESEEFTGRPWWFFSLARYNPGGPTYYGGDIRMPADRYLTRTVMGIIAAAVTILLVLIITLPIIKNRIHSLIAAVNCIGIGVTISLCLVCPSWLRGYATIQSPVDYLSTKDQIMEIGIHVGLAFANITLSSIDPLQHFDNGPENELTSLNFFYNEKLEMFKPELLEPSLGRALSIGLPIPLLSVIHFMTSATSEFHWSQNIMEAGYHCYLGLMFALFVWVLALLFTAGVPRYSCYAFIVIGFLMVATIVMYFFWTESDHHFPCIFISGEFIELRYGICFWGCLSVGLWSCIFGFSLSVYDMTHPDKFLTIFDIDYDKKRSILVTLRGARYSSKHSNQSDKMEEPVQYVHRNVPLR